MKPKTFLGTGWSFPPAFNKLQATVETVSDEEDVFQSLHILLSTQLKERVMRSDFGCDLSAMLYENITVTLLTKIKGIITEAILKYEPRVDLLEVEFFNENNTDGLINIEITYRIRATNSRKNFVFPYYIKEGTFVKS
ncbi:GPW/gp25 family protein [Chryseobacterium sp.]|uniref:GPW/gp25 family protein n=1 Tax=Chryseobacterium sp. TaxID=1871047 RepID=UPI0028A11145|nr:GPW/gp25 family protein [Chryseobacterium sp.]